MCRRFSTILIAATFAGGWPAASQTVQGVALVPVRQIAQAESSEVLAGLGATTAIIQFDPPDFRIDEAPDDILMARVTADGLPEPSIVVGYVQPGMRISLGLGPAIDVVWSDREGIGAVRDENPGNFQEIVLSGAFDPPSEDDLVRQLQRELNAMECYLGPIDGIWGRGSTGGVTNFFRKVGVEPPETLEPRVELYRQILILGPVTCDRERRAAARQSRPQPNRNAGSSASSNATPAQPVQPQSDPKPRRGGLGPGIGIVR